jgi:hypothetical protein
VNLKRTMIHNWRLHLEIAYAATVLFALTIGPIYTLWRNAQSSNSAAHEISVGQRSRQMV